MVVLAWCLALQAIKCAAPAGRYTREITSTLRMDEDTHTDTPQKLSDSDQAKVDAFLARGVNSVDRKPFRPLFLIFLLMAVVAGFSLLSQGIAQWAGIY